MEHKFGRGYRRSIFTSMFFFNDDRLDRFLSPQGFLSLGLKFSFNLTWLKEADHPRHETMYSNIISPLPPPLPSLPFWRELKKPGKSPNSSINLTSNTRHLNYEEDNGF